MLRHYFGIVSLVAGAIVFWLLNLRFSDPTLYRLSMTFILASVLLVVYLLLSGPLAKRFITDRRNRYTFRKAVSILVLVLLIASLVPIWVENTESLVVSYGIFFAGVAIALQDVFRNIVGGLIIALSGIYRVGDRIEVDDLSGDVMDIGIMNTMVMELGGAKKGGVPTGRLAILPNAIVITSKIINSTKDHSFVWDEITIPLTYESDWQAATLRFLELIRQETGAMSKKAEQEIDRLDEKYYFPENLTEPAVYVRLTDNWIELGLRYVTEARKQRTMHTRLNRLLIEDINSSELYHVASENIDVTGRHTVNLIHESGP